MMKKPKFEVGIQQNTRDSKTIRTAQLPTPKNPPPMPKIKPPSPTKTKN